MITAEVVEFLDELAQAFGKVKLCVQPLRHIKSDMPVRGFGVSAPAYPVSGLVLMKDAELNAESLVCLVVGIAADVPSLHAATTLANGLNVSSPWMGRYLVMTDGLFLPRSTVLLVVPLPHLLFSSEIGLQMAAHNMVTLLGVHQSQGYQIAQTQLGNLGRLPTLADIVALTPQVPGLMV